MKKFIPSLLLALATLAAAPAALADEIYIQIPGVPGESTANAYPGLQNWSRIDSVQFGVSRPVGSGPAQCSGILFAKNADSTSPLLFGKVVTGTALGSVKISYARLVQGELLEYQLVELQNPVLESQTSITSGERPAESYSLFVDQLRITYKKLDANGDQVGAPFLFPAGGGFHDFTP